MTAERAAKLQACHFASGCTHRLDAISMSSPPAPPPVTENTRAAYELLDVAVALTDAAGALQWANSAWLAATAWAPAECIGRGFDAIGGLAVTIDVARAAAAAVKGPCWAERLGQSQGFSGLPVHIRRPQGIVHRGSLGMRVAGAQRVLSLQLDSPAGSAESQRLTLARNFGRVGFWQRDLRTGLRHWDDEVWAAWGLQAAEGALDYERTMQAVVPEDRDALQRAFDTSFKQCGRHGMRYRVRGHDGRLRHLHSEWEVRADAHGEPAMVLGILRDDTETLQLTQSTDRAQAHLKLAAELAGIAIWRQNLATGQIEVNDQGWEVLGRDRNSGHLTVAEVRERLHPQDIDEVVRLTKLAAQQDGPVDIGARFRRDDGRWRYVLMRGAVQRDGDDPAPVFVGVSIDLSERFEQAQRSSELTRRLEMTTSAAGVGIWSYHLNTREVLWDEQMLRLHGLEVASVPNGLGHYLERCVHEEDRAALKQGVQTLMRRKTGLLDLDFRVLRQGGQTRRMASRTSVESSDGQLTLYGVMFDVTERHDAEARLRAATERVALATRGAGIGTWEYAIEDGHLWWDAQMLNLRGMAMCEMPMRFEHALLSIHPDDRPLVKDAVHDDLAEGRTANYEFRVIWPDGRVRWLASRATVIRGEAGLGPRRIGINWDITEVRAAAAEHQERLLAQHESQAKSQFMARISHELRTPLNAILGFTQLLLSEAGQADGPLVRQRMQHIQLAGEHLLGLINEVLDLSSLQSGELPLQAQPVDLAGLVAQALPLVENLAREHGVALLTGALDLCVQADPMRLRQALINLLSNAIKYNHRGGQVSVDAQADAEHVLLRVRDTGRGMSAEQLRHLYEPFNRLGMERDGIAGTGIGLAIVRAAVQHMGGEVKVSSEPGVGSCFELRLPAAAVAPVPEDGPVDGPEDRPEDRPEAERGAAAGAGKGTAAWPSLPLPGTLKADAELPPGLAPSVLYIEDNPVNMIIVAELIGRRPDLRFHGAVDGHSGVAMALQLRPTLVLIDMQLPDIDGMEVLRRIRADAHSAQTRCVALSANAMPSDVQDALRAGFSAYWTKPLDFAGFMTELEAQFGPAPSA